MITKIDGQLEIHHERGVIYFHSSEAGWCVLRICNLPKPIPSVDERQLDITHLVGTDWRGNCATRLNGVPTEPINQPT